MFGIALLKSLYKYTQKNSASFEIHFVSNMKCMKISGIMYGTLNTNKSLIIS